MINPKMKIKYELDYWETNVQMVKSTY